MKNKLADLNDHLFAQLERLSDENITPEQLEVEVKRTAALVDVSDRITDNARTVITACKLVAEHGTQFLPSLTMLNGPKLEGHEK